MLWMCVCVSVLINFIQLTNGKKIQFISELSQIVGVFLVYLKLLRVGYSQNYNVFLFAKRSAPCARKGKKWSFTLFIQTHTIVFPSVSELTSNKWNRQAVLPAAAALFFYLFAAVCFYRIKFRVFIVCWLIQMCESVWIYATVFAFDYFSSAFFTSFVASRKCHRAGERARQQKRCEME